MLNRYWQRAIPSSTQVSRDHQPRANLHLRSTWVFMLSTWLAGCGGDNIIASFDMVMTRLERCEGVVDLSQSGDVPSDEGETCEPAASQLQQHWRIEDIEDRLVLIQTGDEGRSTVLFGQTSDADELLFQRVYESTEQGCSVRVDERVILAESIDGDCAAYQGFYFRYESDFGCLDASQDERNEETDGSTYAVERWALAEMGERCSD